MANKIYFDYAATTPVSPEVLKKMIPYFSEDFGNPMSIHGAGQKALEAVDEAREEAAEFFGCSSSEIIFTSGATESNNMAIKGILRSFVQAPLKKKAKPHIITTKIEHHSVIDVCKAAEKDGLAEITFINSNREGLVSARDIERAIKPNTVLVSVMYVNNEIGTVQPIGEIGRMIKKTNIKRHEEKLQNIFFHTDATQAINYFNCDASNLGIDMLSMSAHKIYGPKGIGLLYVRKSTPIKNTQQGGDQEFKLRAGTHNVPGIVGLGKAISMINEQEEKNQAKEIEKMRDYLTKRMLEEIPKSYLNGSSKYRSPNNANFRFDDVEGEGLVLSLDLEGIATSTGSACSSGSLEPSHVLLSLGLRHEQAHGSLRVTLGKYTTREDVDTLIIKTKEAIERLRRISGNVLAEFK